MMRNLLDEPASEVFDRLAMKLCENAQVTRKDSKGFASGGLFKNGKLFGVRRGDELLVKLPRTLVAGLVESNRARPFEGSNGRVMREWVLVSNSADWEQLLVQALEFSS